MSRAGGLAALAVLAVLLPACRAKVSPQDCELMLDRYVSMRIDGDPGLAQLPPQQAAVVREERQREERSRYAYRRALAQCADEVSRAEWTCAMEAKAPNDWEACID